MITGKYFKKWWVKTALILLALVIIAFFGISIFLGMSMTRPKRLAIDDTPASWGLEYSDISFKSDVDEITLRGWFLPADDSERVIIIVHGADGNREDKSVGIPDIIEGLVDNGYNVLTFDLRGHGESDGNRMSAGYYEVRDLTGAVGYAEGMGFENIGVLGFSIGAVTAIFTAAENKSIDALVSDSSSADLNDIIGPEFSKRTKFPRVFISPILFMVKLMFGVDFTAIRPVEYVPDIAPRPVLFIHGKLDEVIPYEHSVRLYQAAGNPDNRLWLVPEAGHVRSFIVNPDEYMEKILGFFNTALR